MCTGAEKTAGTQVEPSLRTQASKKGLGPESPLFLLPLTKFLKVCIECPLCAKHYGGPQGVIREQRDISTLWSFCAGLPSEP